MKNPEPEKEYVIETSTIITQTGATQTEIAALPDVVITMQHCEADDSDFKNNTSDTNVPSSDNAPIKSPVRKLQRSSTARKPLNERRVNFSERSVSQDTDASHSTSTSSDIRLPPILLPIISSLENVKLSDGTEPVLKRWESVSSVEPVINSSFSSLPSSTSDSEEEANNKRRFRRAPTAVRRREQFSSMRSKSVCDPESRRAKANAKNFDNSENASNVSGSTNVGSVTASSTSSSDQNTKILRREGSVNGRLSNRNIRSATIARRNERASSANRAATARIPKTSKSLASLKSSEPVPKPIVPATKDREQGRFTVLTRKC